MNAFIDHGTYILRTADGARIPLDPANRDYVRYQRWLAAGNDADLPPAPTLAERQQALKDQATQRRWEVETGGMIIGGVTVRTETSDQLRLGNVIKGMVENNYASVPFKAASGWVDLTLAEMEGVFSAVAEHVRQCYLAERAHHLAIDGLTTETVDAYDVNANWPS